MLASATLTGLNVVWFGKMIQALIARFKGDARPMDKDDEPKDKDK